MGILGNQECFGRGKGREDEDVSALLSQIGSRKNFPEDFFLWSLDQSYVSYGLCCYQEIGGKTFVFSLVFIFLATFLWREK